MDKRFLEAYVCGVLGSFLGFALSFPLMTVMWSGDIMFLTITPIIVLVGLAFSFTHFPHMTVPFILAVGLTGLFFKKRSECIIIAMVTAAIMAACLELAMIKGANIN